MGQGRSKSKECKSKVDREEAPPTGLKSVTSRAEERNGRLSITGRYHRLPKRFRDDYQATDQVLGSGYNGEVRMATCKTTGAHFAVKGFKLGGVDREKKKELETEAEIFLAMDHPHVASLVDVYESNEMLDLVMECMSGGELFDRVVERKRFSEKDAAEALYQMLLAINYIHSHGVVHRDIKLENFLYETKDSDHLKLIDFGFSKIWQPNTTMAVSCGTLSYVAPEVMDKSYTSQCDLWSLGVTAFILLFGYMPFAGNEQQQIKNIKDGKYGYKPEIWKKVSKSGQDFVKTLLLVDPSKRMTAAQALDHHFIAKRASSDGHVNVVDQAIIEDLCNFGKASVFRRACMGVLAWSLTLEERKQVRDAFLALDTTHSGTITLSEFKKAVEGQFHIDDETLMKAFQALDSNHKDEINYHEFLAAMVSTRIALHDDLLKVSFRRFDTDNSGYITVDNLREVLGETFEGAEVEQLLSEADLRHDGKISYEEWIEYLRGAQVKDDHAHAAARVIDTTLQSQEAVRKDKKMRTRAPDGFASASNPASPGSSPAAAESQAQRERLAHPGQMVPEDASQGYPAADRNPEPTQDQVVAGVCCGERCRMQ